MSARRMQPSRDAALGLDHSQPEALEFGEVRCDAVSEDEAFVTASLASRTVVLTHTSVVTPQTMSCGCRGSSASRRVGSVKRTLAWLVHDGLAHWVGSAIMSWPGSPRTRMRPIGPGSPIRREPAARLLGGRQVREVGAMTLARVDDVDPASARRRGGAASAARPPYARARRRCPVPRRIPPGSTKSRCMSMTTRPACPAIKSKG